MPFDIRQEILRVPIVARYELLKQIRRFRLYGLLLIGSVVTGLAMALAAIYLPSIGGFDALGFDLYIVSYGQIGFFALIAGVFFSGDALSSEFEHKTGYLMFINPLSRTTLLIGKYLSCCIASAVAVAVPYLVILLGDVLLFGQFPSELILSFLFTLLYACSIIAFTFIFSSLFKGSMGASVLPFILMFFVFRIISQVMQLGGVEPFVFLDYGSGIIANILSVPYPPHMISILFSAGGINIVITSFYASVAEGLIIMASYLVVGLITSILIFRRRQME